MLAPKQEHSTEKAPLWTRLGQRSEFGGNNIDGRAAFLDLHSVLALRRKGSNGAGDLDDLEYDAQIMIDAGFSGIQINPINDTGDEPCPYCAVGLMSYDPAPAAVDRIPALKNSDEFSELRRGRREAAARHAHAHPNRFDHNAERAYKIQALDIAYRRIEGDEAFVEDRRSLDEYCESCDPHMRNYALFTALKAFFEQKPWWEWPDMYKHGNAEEILKNHSAPDDPIAKTMREILYIQSVMEEQWTDAAKKVEDMGGSLVMDKAIYPQHDSADVWGNQHLFYLNTDGSHRYMSGCKSPGDPYGEQTWGHPVYKFNEDAETTELVVDFFVDSVRHMTKVAKVIRLDHALALAWKYYLVATGEGDVSHHKEALKHTLLQRLKREFPDVFFIAEDVGYVSPDVDRVLEENGMPGMRSPIWGPLPDHDSVNPHYGDTGAYPKNSVAVTGNHDTLEPREFAQTLRDEQSKIFHRFFTPGFRQDRVIDPNLYMKDVFASPSFIAATNFRTLGGDPRRYNAPGTVGPENWSAQTPETVDTMNFKPVSRIITDTGRRIRDIHEYGKVMASLPLMGEEQHRKAGEEFSIRVAVRKMPEGITVFTNAPVQGHGTGTEWGERYFGIGDEHLLVTQYEDGITVIEVRLLIDPKATPGKYEGAANVEFTNQSEPLCKPERNMKFVVTV